MVTAPSDASPTSQNVNGENTAGISEQKWLQTYTRQNAAFGAETTRKMTQMKILMVGVDGVCVEVAKNLVLQGCGYITLLDSTPVKQRDLGVNFFLSEADVGKKKQDAVAPKLQELNPLVKITKADSAALTDELCLSHSVVIISDNTMTGAQLEKFNTTCRNKKDRATSFIYVRQQGCFASVFVDHGDHHLVHDPNGENPMIRIVDSIEEGDEPLIKFQVPEGQPPSSLPEGCYIELSNDVVGMKGLDKHEVVVPSTGEKAVCWKTTQKSGDPVNSIRLVGSTKGLGAYKSGGTITEKKVAEKKPSKSFATSLKNPGMPFCDMVGTDMLEFGSELQIHTALAAQLLNDNALTKDQASGAAKKLIESKKLECEIDVDDNFHALYAEANGIQLQPMCAFLGGVVGQEVVKVTGKFTPIPGFFHFHCKEVLPEEKPVDIPSVKECDASRYGDLMAIFGRKFVEEKLLNQKLFMVGCGALGCELLKNFALNGICCGKDGQLTITDADRIELSNLTRQFLFREHNVGQPKSVAAANMVRTMNKDIKIKAQEMFVGKISEDTFDDAFWMSLDSIVNALDNMEARFYVDEQCVKYEKPLLESGTMGPSGNVDPIVPHKTKTYRDGGQAAAGGGIPMCTLRNFPHLPDHCIEWARDLFELILVKLPNSLKTFLDDPSAFCTKIDEESTDVGQSLFEVRLMSSLLNAVKNPSLETSAQVSYNLFHYLFRDKIQDLITAFPENARVIDKDTKQDKGAFWSGHKRFPKVAKFDINDETHTSYMICATNLFGMMIGANPVKEEDDETWVKNQRTVEWLKPLLAKCTAPDYVGGSIKLEDDDPNADGTADSQNQARKALNKLLAQLESDGKGFALKKDLVEADFEKDDDFNFHIQFITDLANLRSSNYYIPLSDFQKVKLIAGRIIPAIATTTASVTGLVMLEFLKSLLGKPCTALRQRLVGLATNTYTSFEQDEPIKYKSGELKLEVNPSQLPANAFDDAGKIKPEFIPVEKYAAYPEGHTVWDKLVVKSADMKLSEFKDWLAEEHKLQLQNWQFVLGHKLGGENNKEKMPVSDTIYPPPASFDTSLFPPLDLDTATAMGTIMKSPTIPQASKMKYFSEWTASKKRGTLPEPVPDNLKISMSSSLREILGVMARKAKNLADKTDPLVFDKKFGFTVTEESLKSCKFVFIPAAETPSCDVELEDDDVPVKYLASMKIML